MWRGRCECSARLQGDSQLRGTTDGERGNAILEEELMPKTG